MTVVTPTVTQLVVAAFTHARAHQQGLAERWVKVSYRIGGYLPNSLMTASVQREGEIDAVLRCMEVDCANRMKAQSDDGDLFSFHYQAMFSVSWISNCYEFLRAVKQRKIEREKKGEVVASEAFNTEFNNVFRGFEILRVTLDKHELPRDRQLAQPLQMERTPKIDGSRDTYTYDKSDTKRGHIMPSGVSQRGSIMWFATDPSSNESGWIERQELSDRLIALFEGQPQP